MTFHSWLVPVDPHPTPMPLLAPGNDDARSLVRMCSWCKKIERNQAWVKIEEAVEKIELLDALHLYRITHTICPDCYRQMMKETRTVLRESSEPSARA
jgi:hypothetical protein